MCTPPACKFLKRTAQGGLVESKDRLNRGELYIESSNIYGPTEGVVAVYVISGI